MEENKAMPGHSDNSHCAACHMGNHNPRSVLLRWLLGILILVAVFAIGVKVGEFKSFFDNDADTMFRHHRYFMMENRPDFYPNAMYGNPGANLRTTTNPTTTPAQ
jgi:hypothetical protein